MANSLGFPQIYDLNSFMENAQANYDLSNVDKIGEKVRNKNNVNTLNFMTLEAYDKVTKHETDFRILNMFNGYGDFYLDAFYEDDPNHRVYFYSLDGPVYQGYTHLHYYNGSGNLASNVMPFFEIKLPSKHMTKIASVESDPINQTKKSGEDIDLFCIHTVEGEGPFHFYIYDTDKDGVGNEMIPSSHFTLEQIDNQFGTAKVNQIQKLLPGDYYFKVKVVDECVDESLYEYPSDFSIDKSRTKETQLIHVLIQKQDLSITFQNPAETKKSISEAQNDWFELASVNPSDGTKITYSIVGGDIGLIDIDKDTGKIKYKQDGAFGKVKIRATADDDPSTGNDIYRSAYAEKDIIITREVDGIITPDPASSDMTIPTFSTDKSNIKTNGIIGTIKGTLGTPDTIGDSIITYKYTLKTDGDGSLFKVDANTGVIQSNANLAVGTYHFTITVSDRWSSKDVAVQVNVGKASAENLKFYENSSSSTIITKKTVRITATGEFMYATVKGSSNTNPVTYKIKDGEPQNILDVHPNSGAVTLKKVGTVIIVAQKQGTNGQADAIAELTFTVTAGSQEFIYVDESGNELPKISEKYKAYEEVYENGKTFQLYTEGGISSRFRSNSGVTYALKKGSPTDVISVEANGLVHILNASLNTQKGKVIVEATSHDANGNYEDMTIELPIDILKADQKISFADVTNAQNGKGKVTPVINEQDISSNEGGVTLNDTDYFISVDESANGIAWTNNGIDIEYNYSGDTTIEIPLHVEKAGNRNYNKAVADGILRILGQEESTLAINQLGKVVYGDHFTIRSLQDDSSCANVQYTFEVNNTIYISQSNVNGNKAEFDALKNSGNTEIEIKVTRTADGEVALSKTIKIKVL
ncbi:MAG: cadherin repeat domain-containing protein, partial [Erysipelotrichaceae bacterium]|nr:cadherin repeat domain-containing protein [Erysipelotrichaceae bacterium]